MRVGALPASCAKSGFGYGGRTRRPVKGGGNPSVTSGGGAVSGDGYDSSELMRHLKGQSETAAATAHNKAKIQTMATMVPPGEAGASPIRYTFIRSQAGACNQMHLQQLPPLKMTRAIRAPLPFSGGTGTKTPSPSRGGLGWGWGPYLGPDPSSRALPPWETGCCSPDGHACAGRPQIPSASCR